MAEVKITGGADLQKMLNELPAKIEGRILRGAVRAGAKVIEEKAKELVPVRTGKLKDSIKVSTRSRRGQISATVRAGDRKSYYAQWVEFGTAKHFIKPKESKSLFFAGMAKEVVNHPGASAKPFMRPALDSSQEQAVRAFADYVQKRLAKEAAKK